MTGSPLLVRTPSRLHFGLLGWGPEAIRQFGGLGLMVEEPAIEFIIAPAEAMSIEGPLANRAGRIVAELRQELAERGLSVPPLSIRILSGPPEHVGLGVGTQLSLAIALAIFRLAGWSVPPPEELARLTGRGRRSGIGLHGFFHGGLIVDGGRKNDHAIPPLIARVAFPPEWSVILIQPPGTRGLHGSDEVRAFVDLPPPGGRLTDRLCRIVLLGILPAMAESDLAGFGEALEELQTHVGAAFAPVQGGAFRAGRAPEIIGQLHRAGLVGCGQSSWGPTLYGFTDRTLDDLASMADLLRAQLDLKPNALIVTRASDRGASFTVK